MQNDIIRRPVAQQDVVAAPVDVSQPPQTVIEQSPSSIEVPAPPAIPETQVETVNTIKPAKPVQSKPVGIIVAAIIVFCGLSGAVIYGTMQTANAKIDTSTALR